MVVVVVCCYWVVCCWDPAGGGTLSDTTASVEGTGFCFTVVGTSVGKTGTVSTLDAELGETPTPAFSKLLSKELGLLAGRPVR